MQVGDLLPASSESDEKEANDADNTHFITINSDAKKQIAELAKAGNFAAIDDLITKGADIRGVVFCVAKQATENKEDDVSWINGKIDAAFGGNNYINLIDAARGGFILAKNEMMVTTLVALAPSDFSIYGYTVFALAFMDEQDSLFTQLNVHFNEANMDAALRGAMAGEHNELINQLSKMAKENFSSELVIKAKLTALWEFDYDYDSDLIRIIKLLEQASEFDYPSMWRRWLCGCLFSTKVTGRVAELCVIARQDTQLSPSIFIEQLESIEGIQSSPWIWRCIELIRYQNSTERVSESESSDVSEWLLMHPVT